jgi:hypothetical protein
MKTDHLQTFPVPVEFIPGRLRQLLNVAPIDAGARIDVLVRFEHDMHGPDKEYIHMQMAVIPEDDADGVGVLRESDHGVVAFGTPDPTDGGAMAAIPPSVSGFGYIVASFGNGQSYGYALADRVWMTLGLVPRGFGNYVQKIAYDDLAEPVFDVAGGELSSTYHFAASRNVHWTMSNSYLRRYLWLHGAVGARVFFYEALVDDAPALRDLMQGARIAELASPDWCRVQLREHGRGHLLLQVWATVTAVPPLRLALPDASTLAWPDMPGPMSRDEVSGRRGDVYVYLDDRVLEHYERDSRFDTTPSGAGDGLWGCSPGYGGQWSFTDWTRVGRNLIRVPLHALYKGVPDAETLRVHPYALRRPVWEQRLGGEHIVAKVDRLAAVLLDLADGLSALSQVAGPAVPASAIFALSRAEVGANGWGGDAMLRRLAQVVPEDMDEQAFLARCKVLHERWQRVPDGLLRRIIIHAGVPKAALKEGFGSLKLLQALCNITERLNTNLERVGDALPTTAEPEDWALQNPHLAALFVAHELRVADAHPGRDKTRGELERFGYDIAGLNMGHGVAFEAVLDGAVAALGHVSDQIAALVGRN